LKKSILYKIDKIVLFWNWLFQLKSTMTKSQLASNMFIDSDST